MVGIKQKKAMNRKFKIFSYTESYKKALYILLNLVGFGWRRLKDI